MRGKVPALIAALALCALAPSAAAKVEPRIVGGAPANISQAPWQVAVADSQSAAPGQDGYDRQFCGGSLVAPTLVVTAAHCVYEFNPVPLLECSGVGEGFNFPAADFAVFTGRTTLSSSEGQEIDVKEIYYFEDAGQAQAQSTGDGEGLYNCETNQWDAVLLELTAPSSSPTIRLAGADERSLWAAGASALISGWGSLSDGGAFPDDLRAATVPIVEDQTCVSNYAGGGITIDPQTMVCAGVAGKDTCSGDSGGPLAVPGEVGSALEYRLVGDTSFGIGCAEAQFPGVYGRIADSPMRGALAAAAQQIAGADIVGSGARAVGPPETTIGKRPKKTVRTRKKKARAKFTFNATEPASFQCKVDRKSARACSSPFATRVRRGRHTFTVAATDSLKNADATPATYKWRVKRKRG
jgi:secreted trypsin-like serine protease